MLLWALDWLVGKLESALLSELSTVCRKWPALGGIVPPVSASPAAKASDKRYNNTQ